MKHYLYDWDGANAWLFHAINSVHSEALDWLMLTGTEIADYSHFPWYLGFIVAVSACFAYRARGRSPGEGAQLARDALFVVSVFSLAYLADAVLISWMKPFFAYPRPLAALGPGTVNVVGEREVRNALPSGHASFAMVFAASVWPAVRRRWRAVLALYVLWIGLARVSVGAHFPADVVAAWISALAIVVVTQWAIGFALYGRETRRARRARGLPGTEPLPPER